MNNALTKNKSSLEALSFTLKRQDLQSEVLQQVIETVIQTKDEMVGIKDEIVEIKEDISKDIAELRDSIVLNRKESSDIQSAVSKQAWWLTEKFFDKKVSDDLFLAKLGHFRGIVYKMLKEEFDLPRYCDLKRVDFKRALLFIGGIKLANLKTYQLRLTPRQKEIAMMNNDDISKFD